MMHLSLAIVLALSGSEVVKTTVKGDPGLKSIEVLGFAPDGILLVGDGKGAQIVALMTGDTKAVRAFDGKLDGIDAKLAGRLGGTAKEIEILDLAVNPASSRIYFAVRRQSDKSSVILTLDGSGKIEELGLKSIEHARIPLPQGETAAISKVTDVAFAGGRVLAAGRANEEFASKIFVAKGPIVHNAEGAVYSAETYHVQHGKWETKAPMSVLMPYEENGKLFIVGAYSCTPVVKYPIDALQPGAKVKGLSMLELGSGNQPLDMFTYTKGGKTQVLMNTFRFHHEKKPFGPSPYWSASFDHDLLGDPEKVNEKAVRRLAGDKPATERIRLVESLHGAVHLDRLNDAQALVLRKTAEGFDLEAIALP